MSPDRCSPAAPPSYCAAPVRDVRLGMPPKLKVNKSSVSLPRQVRADGTARAKELGLPSFSAYVSLLIQNDLRAPDAPLVIHAPPRLKR